MDDNVMLVLQMLQDGKISANEAETLIAALHGEPSPAGSTDKKAPNAEPQAEHKPFMEDFKAKINSKKIDLDLEHLGEKISKAVAKVQPEKIVARVQAQLRTATKNSATWGASMSARVRNWTDGADVRPENKTGLPEHRETHEQQAHLEATADVLIENPLGNVVITGIDGDAATLTINKVVWGPVDSLKAIADSVVVNVFATDSRLDVKVTAPDHFHDGILDLEIAVPRSCATRTSTRFGGVSVSDMSGRVEAVTSAGAMKLSSLQGDVRGETASGAISLANVAGAATVATQSGDISAETIGKGLSANSASGDVKAKNLEGGRVECKSVSGDVHVANVGAIAPLDIVVESLSGDATLEDASGNIAIKAVSGDISARQILANRVQAQTVSGDVKIRIQNAFSGTAQVNTVSGDIDLGLPLDTNARVSLSTTSGDLRCDHDAQSVVATETLWTGQIGTGAGNITVQTISGDAHISNSGSKTEAEAKEA